MKVYISKRIYIVTASICLAFAGCKQSFEPNVSSKPTNYLVVDGIINCGNDSTTVTLSRTVPLSQKQTVKAEAGATLSVESDNGIFYKLIETKKGVYKCAPLNLPLSNTYRLNIKTVDGKIYQSEFVEAKVTPPIDDLPYDRTSEGLEISVNTRDDSNKTIYYRWSYEETWKFHSDWPSYYESINKAIVYRNTSIYYCYRTENLLIILMGSTLKLNNDVVYKRLLKFIPNSSDRISEKYSINVRQYALTKAGYEFWDNERKNTEQLGGIFDPQPSAAKGNIMCISAPAELVVGFVSVSTESRKRIFITPDQVKWGQPSRSDGCKLLDTVKGNDTKKFDFLPGQQPYYLINDEAKNERGNVVGFLATTPECIDCRLRGTLTVPSFWR